MKNIFLAIFLCFIFNSSFSNPHSGDPKTSNPSSSYVVLNNGERIDNISAIQWEIFNKTGTLVLGERVLTSESLLWIRDTKGLWLMYAGYRYKCEVEGRISVYRTSMTLTRSNGIMIFAPKYFVLTSGETKLDKPLNYENLVKAISDDPQALAKADKLHRRLINRDIVAAQLKIIQQYNKK